MSLKLKADGQIPYSTREKQLFDLLPKTGKRIASSDLRERFYAKTKLRQTRNAQISITGALQSLRRKVEDNRESFRICHSERRGPWPIEFWIEK